MEGFIISSWIISSTGWFASATGIDGRHLGNRQMDSASPVSTVGLGVSARTSFVPPYASMFSYLFSNARAFSRLRCYE